jgi:hypothetical protein
MDLLDFADELITHRAELTCSKFVAASQDQQ